MSHEDQGSCTGPAADKLSAELVTPTYTFFSRGRAKVEAKEEMKKRLGRSPDRADALGLAIIKPEALPNRSGFSFA